MESHKHSNSLREGYILHWYEIKRIIGRGGFGITYLAHDNNLDRYVAIKEFMPEDFATRESDSTVHPKTGEHRSLYEWGLERFIKEARTLAKFNHPNIVRVLSVFEENNTAYMVMEYAQGEDLSTVYKKSPKFTEERFLDTFIPIMDGLALVHNAGFIHRDIKPANIYICENNSPLLLDFGSARQSMGGKTKALTSLVTYGYAPFEQYNEGSGKQGPWTDIYSLGACIYVGVTGQKPVDALQRGGNFLETGIDSYRPLSIIAKDEYSENFLLAVDNALMFKIEERPQNIMDWADMLLGKTLAPELPEHMTRSQEDDKTIVQPTVVINANVSTAPSQGTQGLVDAHGKRNTDVTDTMMLNRNRSVSERSGQPDIALDSGSTKSGIFNRLSESINGILSALPIPGKARLPVAIGIATVIVLSVVVSLFFSGPPAPDTTETAQDVQQQHKQLEQLLDNAEQALTRKHYVTPDNNNAHYYYQQALKIDPDSNLAKQGLSKLESRLLVLARNEYDNGDMTAAQRYLDQLDIVNPYSDDANKLNADIQDYLNNATKLNDLLNKANSKLQASALTRPENDSAYFYYQQALTVNPASMAAKKGISDIEDRLYKLASSAYSSNQYSDSLDYLAQLESVNPESRDAKSLKNKILENQSRQEQIASWLGEAAEQKKNDQYTSPKNSNAFDTYNKILKLDPDNQQALDGIKNIHWHYKTLFDQYIETSGFSKADSVIRIMKQISAPSYTIAQMQKTLADSRKATTTPSNLNIHQVSKIVGEFKMALQKHNEKDLKNMCEYAPGREQFVSQLLAQYRTINVKISDLQLISKENQAKAHVELTDLVDINSNKVTPGSWSKFEIIVRENNKKQLKIYW